ncbi:NADH-quinone oxidoreductase subunit L [Actinopolymorpha cephalotaxi]|uniref:NADH-quinone oxidoreductase subunit L n=1 Tax=Actinopolymorpha cephalotaxi TaxID=504797 RepID=A0A1I2NL97_9ACTN|nr:NADH-quinone oxidoreductase subunit L [Actinopolymorpha cephalotaxi]SFG04408.1 NADH-quinone oxidoreductase subunit L [Actinopolymorpha cephalotaxi]
MTTPVSALALAGEQAAHASGVFSLLWLIVAIPAVSAAVILLSGRAGNAWGHLLGCAAPIASFVLGAVMFFSMVGRGPEDRAVAQQLYTFIPLPGYHVEAGLLLDQLSVCFVLLITGVGSIIHIYSLGYMAHDERRKRFFGYLNLFVSAMLLLVLANDFLVVFIGWEGVGLASYLLIGFWQHKHSAATAAKKAFVVNRVGDVGLSLAVMLMLATFGTSSFAGVFSHVGAAGTGIATALGFLLLLGACGKSAQFPLQSWLLDAMEGPTPVSALIHAATMVTAGVYLVTRSNAIFDQAPVAQTAVVLVGTITLLMGAVIGCAKDDIKKTLAGSTMSQIGYMMLAAGLGPVGYAFAIFHLLTHGFFKADMFLGAGSVMHGMNDEVNMRRYGALRKFMPITFGTFFVGYLAIIGIPPFAGFFSKDKIIEVAFASNFWIGLCALLGAGVTAFYMTRLVYMTFLGHKRWAKDTHPHESPSVMTVPLILLAFLSLVGGAGLAYLGGGIVKWLEPVVGEKEAHLPFPLVLLTIVTLLVVLLGIAVAWLFVARREVPTVAPVKVSPITTAARRDLYGDAVNEVVLMRPGQEVTRGMVGFDNRGVDGVVNGLAAFFGGVSGRVRRVQTGFVRSYALVMIGGAALVVVSMLLVRLS